MKTLLLAIIAHVLAAKLWVPATNQKVEPPQIAIDENVNREWPQKRSVKSKHEGNLLRPTLAENSTSNLTRLITANTG